MRLFNNVLGMFLLAAGAMLLAPALPALAQQGPCSTDDDCTDSDFPFCHVIFNICVECLVDSQCDDGLFCNGAEECRIDGQCMMGDAPCKGTGLLCDEDDDQCGPCAEGSDSEDEPDCGFDENGNPNDTTNGGCFADEPAFSDIACGDQICGTTASPGIFGFARPDSDWYEIEVEDDDAQLTWTVVAEFDVAVFIHAAGPDGDEPCVGSEMLETAAGAAFDVVTVSRCVAPGTYYVVVTPISLFPIACGAQYSAELTCDDCPEGACCALDGDCTDEVTELACAEDGGAFQGADTDCDSVDCPEICGADDAGDCCEGNDSPGCDDAGCCAAVCEVEPFCCEIEWDPFCGFLAGDLCDETCAAQCGEAEAGDCCEANGSASCDDEDCCDLVCLALPECCTEEWDEICALAAGVACVATCAECAEDSDCDDGEFCTGAETCVEGVCVAGDDPCPDEICDEANVECVECLDDADCDDDDACTDDSCDTAGECVHDAVDCDDNDGCTDDSCDAATGECVHDAVDCDDGDDCTDDSCSDGQCVRDPKDCDDGDLCTIDTCLGDVCIHDADPSVCNDNNDCTDDTCLDGSCINTNNFADCDDGNVCTETDVCDAGVCAGEAIDNCTACATRGDCAAGLECPNGSCQPTLVAPCLEGICAEEGESCVNGKCRADCDDDNPCGDNETCVNGHCFGACVNGNDCDDGVFCNGEETCVDNDCGAGDPPTCPEGEECDTETDMCEEASGACGCTMSAPGMGLTLLALFCLRSSYRRVRPVGRTRRRTR